jgi:anti-sigma B factor antagonist
MDIAVRRAPGVTIVAPRGDLDMAVADRLRQTLCELVDQGERRLVLDLALVAYVDSSGLGALVAATKRARGAGGDIRLGGLVPDVRAIFEITRLAKIIAIHDSAAAAATSWQ